MFNWMLMCFEKQACLWTHIMKKETEKIVSLFFLDAGTNNVAP